MLRLKYRPTLHRMGLKMSDSSDWKLAFSFFWIALLLLSLFRGCMVSEEFAAESISKSGLSDVKVVEDHHVFPGFWGCDFSDPAGFEFTGTHPNGKKTEGIACCGAFFKSCTMRY